MLTDHFINTPETLWNSHSDVNRKKHLLSKANKVQDCRSVPKVTHTPAIAADRPTRRFDFHQIMLCRSISIWVATRMGDRNGPSKFLCLSASGELGPVDGNASLGLLSRTMEDRSSYPAVVRISDAQYGCASAQGNSDKGSKDRAQYQQEVDVQDNRSAFRSHHPF